MSWIKKRGHPTPNPAGPGVPPPSVPMFNPNQHYPENQWQQPQQQQQQQQQMHGGSWYDYNQQQQNYNQHYQYQNYQQQNYGNLQYNQQYNVQNNAYNPLQPTTTATTEGDAWNWGWGDEDNSNIQVNEQVEQQQQQNFNESFSNDTSWNWSLDESNNTKQQQQQETVEQQNTDMILLNDDTTVENRKSTQIDNTKRNKLETPQWSVESQISQESSDDILQTSESDKSYMLSQSSTISHSPVGQELPISEKESVENKEIVSNKFEIPVSSPSSTPQIPPPQSHSDDNINPYKLPQTSRKTTNNPISVQQFGTLSSNFTNNNQLVNLETLPDNSEQPDTVLPSHSASIRKISVSNSQWLENNETPINDRNQYLETGQLSDVDTSNYVQNSNENNNNHIGGNNNNNNNNVQDDTLPPPGLRRMVLGQIEQNENEPLPNFSRMVPGQLENSPNQTGSTPQLDNLRQPFTPIEPPEGLRRMVPGESSSPESTTRQQQQQIDHQQDLEIELEPQQQQQEERSATIGADTPTTNPTTTTPTTNTTTKGDRSETIGADLSVPIQKDQHNMKKAKKTLRRDSIEGQIEEKELLNSIKNLTVSDDSNGEHKKTRRHLNRQDSSDSEQEHTKTSRDRRRYDDRYSPDYYHHRRDRDRDRKYDRRRYKERHYDDDNTDYYSDKERKRYNKDDYDRKYDSLRKEKERRHQQQQQQQHQRRDERYRDTRRNDYYRYDDNYENESRSRASSRSDSIHDSTYRERDHDVSYRDRDRGQDRREHRHRREKDRQRRHHDTYNPYQAFGYDIYSQYYQQYQYYENLRKTDPQAYAQLYRKYYQDAASRETPSYGGEGRASVHSGRSSANDELVKDRFTRQGFYSQTSLPHGGYYRDNHSIAGQYGLDNSSYARTLDQTDQSLLNYEDQQIQRMTPMKFTTVHVKASISSGKLIKVLPNYPLDGQSAIVELYNLDYLLANDDDYQELKQFPGPLIKGVTHKKTIIEYCERKIKDAYNLDMVDPNSYILMWELLILLIRQNGMVVGTDIAELLLKDREVLPKTSSIVSSVGSNLDEINQPDLSSLSSINNNNIKEEEITNKFREYLLYGSCKEALEWAMKHGLWGHALFLASKLDKRTYANVLMRFANGLTMNDPLQTLYQLLSGKIPAAVTCVADEKWGDWRPHLAMILSNSTQRPELNCKSITILGDTLLNRGNLYAAQFCYLMAEVGFGRFDNPETKLVLLGANHHEQQSIRNFARNEAIHMTEIYEYACSLNDDQFTLHEFQRYKYLLSTRLADVGLLEKSLQYLERISKFIETNPNTTDLKLVDDVIKLADRLKFYDPVNVDYIDDDNNDGGYGTNLDTSRPDNSWLKNLKEIQLTLQNSKNNLIEPSYDQNLWQQQQQQQYESYQQQQQQWTEPQTDTSSLLESTQQQQQDGYSLNQYQDQSQYWQQQQQWSDQANFSQETVEEPQPQQQQQNYYGSISQNESDEVEKPPSEDIQQQQPQILMPNQHKTTYNDEPLPHETVTAKKGATKPKIDENPAEKSSGNGWFGGIFSKLTLKPKNQMKLPDDKNPSIVWDPEKKRWVNTEEDNGDNGGEFKPPPKMAEIQPKVSNQPPQTVQTTSAMPQQPQLIENSNSGKPPMPQQANMFKLQRGRNLKKSYIDVFNPNAKPGTQLAPPSMPIQTNPTMNFFVPQPVNDPNAPTDFLTPSQPLQFDENSQMSRWSSTSSLSREVQSYTQRKLHPRR